MASHQVLPHFRPGIRVLQLGVRVDDLRVLQEPVAEVVDHGRDVEDAAQTFIKSRLTHDSVLLRVTSRLSRGPNLAGTDPSTTLRRAAFLIVRRPPPGQQEPLLI